MRIAWTDLADATAGSRRREFVELTGFPIAATTAARADTFLLLPDPRAAPATRPRTARRWKSSPPRRSRCAPARSA